MVQSESETEDVASTGVVVDLDGCVQVECGDRYTLVLTQEGVVYSFGKGSYARLGLGNEDTYIPTRIPSLKHITSIAAGFRHSAALDSGGRVYLWGFNFHNQLGLGEND
jgi:alpha-tubulin suppressor-like RCC1 family protein